MLSKFHELWLADKQVKVDKQMENLLFINFHLFMIICLKPNVYLLLIVHGHYFIVFYLFMTICLLSLANAH